MLVEDVFADKVRALELLAREWAEPFVLAQLLSVCLKNEQKIVFRKISLIIIDLKKYLIARKKLRR